MESRVRVEVLAKLVSIAFIVCGCQGPAEADSASPQAPPESPPEAVAQSGTGAGANAEVPPTTVEEPQPVAPPENHRIFDFGVNRFLAHRTFRGGLWMDVGSPGFARYTLGNRPRAWDFLEEQDGLAVSRATRNELPVTFPLTAEQAASAQVIQLRLWYRSGRYPVEMRIGNQELGSFSLSEGWQTVTAEVPADLLHAGENELTIVWPSNGRDSAGALRNIYVGPEGLDWETAAPLSDWPGPGAEGPLAIRGGEGMAFYSVLPASPALSLQLTPDTSVESGVLPIDSVCALDVRV
ncbi:MAG: hypothetical protein KC561_18950, partial [Myxococcales bacterium]|nr:hypothetical protein [Myxococcales bacterium]